MTAGQAKRKARRAKEDLYRQLVLQAAERVFAPWPDLEGALRDRGLPLYSLETKRPLGEFEMIGFSLQYEMTITNVLTMLDLAGVPAFASEREEGHPLILAGGPVALNPEPFADFFDLLAIGDGEELLPELIERHLITLCRLRRSGR